MYEKMEKEVLSVPASNKKIKKGDRDVTLVENSQSITINDDRPKFSLDNFEKRHEVFFLTNIPNVSNNSLQFFSWTILMILEKRLKRS